MFFIFGWGHSKFRDYGPVAKRICDHCHNESLWHLTTRSLWFTLFFLPVFPYAIRRIVACPVCTYGYELPKSDFEAVKGIAERNRALLGATQQAALPTS